MEATPPSRFQQVQPVQVCQYEAEYFQGTANLEIKLRGHRNFSSVPHVQQPQSIHEHYRYLHQKLSKEQATEI